LSAACVLLSARAVAQAEWTKENARKEYDLTKMWQRHRPLLNPVFTEALVQLTLGAPQLVTMVARCKPAPDTSIQRTAAPVYRKM